MWMQSVKRGRVLAAALQGSRDALSEGGWPHNSRAVRLFYYIDVGWMDQKSYQHLCWTFELRLSPPISQTGGHQHGNIQINDSLGSFHIRKVIMSIAICGTRCTSICTTARGRIKMLSPLEGQS